MGKIIALGGGEIGRPKSDGTHEPVETTAIDKEIIRLTGKTNPKLLFIPTASHDSEGYVKVVQEHFGERLGCKVFPLYLLEKCSTSIEKEIMTSDIIYVGGGDTAFMLETWKNLGVDKILRKAYNGGTVLSGISAGAICWFKYGSSDTLKFQDNNNSNLVRVEGLGLINATLSPHHIREPHRKEGLIKIMKNTPGVGIALDDCSAVEIIGDKYRFITSDNKATVSIVYKKGDKVVYEKTELTSSFKDLDDLTKI